MNPNQLENRLIDFAIAVINACRFIDQSFAAQHLSKQLIRSSTAVALNYGEARSAESNRDFLHKMKIALKELRESYINLKIQKGAGTITKIGELDVLTDENNQLISIFVASIKTSTNKESKTLSK
jgi:four helix bundle protein